MKTIPIIAIAVLLSVTAPAAGGGEGEPGAGTLETIADAIAPSCVDVELFLRFDKGEPPSGLTGGDQSVYVREERPMRTTGFLLEETRVAFDDPGVHPRFVDRIEVAARDARTTATVSGWFTKGGVVLADLAEPLAGTRPLRFREDAAPPWFAFTWSNNSGRRWMGIHPVPGGPLWIEDGGRPFRAQGGLIVDAKGRPAGLPLVERMPVDGSWRGSPLSREWIPAGEMEERIEELARRAGYGILRVELDLRSPRQDSGGGGGPFFSSGDDGATRMDVPGVRLPENRLLVLADLAPKTTARLQKISAHLPKGDPVPAEFEFSLKRLGAFVARIPDGGRLPAPPPVDRDGALDEEDRLVFAHQVLIQGENRLTRTQPTTYSRVRIGWREQIHPGTSGASVYLFTRDGDLLSVPLEERSQSGSGRRWYSRGGDGSFSVAHLVQMIANRKEHEDPSNAPLTEEEENRVAWLGVVLQPLDQELARMNDVSELTGDGRTGGIVSFVYDGSPAAKAGIEVGSILVRVHSPDRPEPIPVQGSSLPFGMPDLGDIPPEIREQFFSRMGGTPWPSVDNPLSRTLTGLGVGSEFTLEYFQGGEVKREKFTVTWAPDHYGSAPRHKSEKLGMTVRELTFEVRRYYRLEEDEPGVIVSRLEPGERAAVAGVLPFQIVTNVDDEPIRTIADFERLAESPGEHRFALRHKTRTQTVKIQVPEE